MAIYYKVSIHPKQVSVIIYASNLKDFFNGCA